MVNDNDIGGRLEFGQTTRMNAVLSVFRHIQAVCAEAAPDAEFSIDTAVLSDRLTSIKFKCECAVDGSAKFDAFNRAKTYAAELSQWLFGEAVDVGVFSGNENKRPYFEITASFI